ncbi:MAG: gamma-glutamyl-gamma-aminobutyrate hydrolase family protein [Bacteroidales bacterium]|nr:gamma-glutamyl-gamma-aminobutyrate hydrolase family protein [Bacteroidales bacterium]
MISLFRTLFLTLLVVISGSLRTALAQPVIGISASVSQNGTMRLSADYADAVRKAGGIPIVLPEVRSEEEADKLLGLVDGLVMTGGADIQPAYYGESVLSETVECVPVRDSSDFLLVRTALRRALPILGICRGAQVLNVALGGSLYQDLPTQCGVRHYQRQPDETPSHPILLERGSWLYGILQRDTLAVNSFHHQSVKRPGKGVRICARGLDGVVEAFEGERIIGVQFHPEKLMAGGDDTFLPLLQDFIRLAGQPKSIEP